MNISYAIRSFNITTKTNGRVIHPFYHHGTEQLQSNVMIVQNTQHSENKNTRTVTDATDRHIYTRL